MKKRMLTVSALLLISVLSLSAQDDKNKNVNKNDKAVLEEHKNGGKTDESNMPKKKPENIAEKSEEKKVEQKPINKEIKVIEIPH